MSDDAFWVRGLSWVWSNWAVIGERLDRLYKWFRKGRGEPDDPGILVIGPGGVGKTTLARLLSGEYTTRLFETPWQYDESVAEERYTLSDDPKTEVVVPPGQDRRRTTTWAGVRSDLASGRYRGVVLLTAYGYHSLPRNAGAYREDPRYAGDKGEFVKDLTAAGLADEQRVFEYLKPGLLAGRSKLWLLVLVAKQDLWWPARADVRSHYTAGEWATAMNDLQAARGAETIRAEVAFASLVIANFVDGEGTRLRPNTEGYDQRMQTESLQRVLEMIDGLREWEDQS